LTLFVCLSVQIQLLYPHPGFVEMDEMLLWQQVQDVIKDAISSDVILGLFRFLNMADVISEISDNIA